MRGDVGWKKVEVGAVRTMVSPKARKRPTWVGDMVICSSGAHERSHHFRFNFSTSLHILNFVLRSHKSPKFPFSRMQTRGSSI